MKREIYKEEFSLTELFTNVKDWIWDKLFLDFYLDPQRRFLLGTILNHWKRTAMHMGPSWR